MTLLERIERSLGDPWDPSNVFSFASIMADDEKEAFPRERLRRLDEIEFGKMVTPKEFGGKMGDLTDLIAIARATSRRDSTATLVKGKCVLGSLPIWVAGSAEQKRRLAEIIMGGGLAALGLTERLNGSDLTSSAMRLTHDESDLRLDGEKWLVNNATMSDCITVLAKSDAGLSFVFVDKSKLAEGSFAYTPKIRLMGVKGLDVSGIRFIDAKLAGDALVGREGQGLEIAIKSLMISRLLCVSFLLGNVETALRLVFEFCEKRKLYGDNVLAIPNVRSRLVASYADFHLLDLFGRASARLIAAFPEQATIHSAASKYYLPTLAESTLHDVHVTLGARYYLAEDFVNGIMQKFARDLPLIGLFDGSSQVNLYAIANQMPAMAEQSANAKAANREELSALFGDDAKSPLPDFKRLRLTARGENVLIASLLALESKDPGVVALQNSARAVYREIASRPRGEKTNQRFYFDLAARLSCLHAGASLVLDARVNGREDAALGRFLVSRTLERLGERPSLSEDEKRECEIQIFDELARRVRGEISFGLEESALPGWYGRLTSTGFSR